MKFRSKIETFDAYQWYQNGDHPEDRTGEEAIDWMATADQYPELLDMDEPVSEVMVDGKPRLATNNGETLLEQIPVTYTIIEGQVVRFFRRPEEQYDGETEHVTCGEKYHRHGFIDEGTAGIVCPGDWVVDNGDGSHRVLLDDQIQREFEEVTPVDIEAACEVMHDAYEKAAVSEGWETQESSRKTWDEVPEANKATMRVAVAALIDHLAEKGAA